QPRAHHAQHLERDLRMRQAQGLKVLFADEEKPGSVNRSNRRWVISAIEHRQLGDRTAGAVNTEYLLASPSGTLEDADVPRLHDVHPGAGIPFSEDQLAHRILTRHRALGQESEFTLRQPRKDGDLRQSL